MKRVLIPVACLFLVLALASCQAQTTPTAPPAEKTEAAAPAAAVPAVAINEAALGAFAPLPAKFGNEANPATEDKVNLGRMMYYDKRFSKNHDISCNSCHGLATFGVDNKPTSPGHKGQLGGRNSPTVYNSAGQFVQFWDGREPDVEAQAKGPVLNPVEMAMPDAKIVLAVINSIPEYVEAFKKAFPGEAEPITYDNFGKAIGAFERGLVTPSKWDKFLTGDKTALSSEEIAGFNKFVETGCTACHTGALIGGHIYQKVGLVKPWPNTADFGRFDVTKQEGDKYMFKVPTLRNIEKTGPYFHDGKTATLAEAIAMMGEYQLGKALAPEDIASIETWLKALTGEVPTAYVAEPTLPPSTDKTPKPDPA